MKEDYVAHFSGRDFRCLDRGYNNNEPIVVVVRPEDIKLVPPTENTINGVVTSIVFMGVHYEIRLQGDDMALNGSFRASILQKSEAASAFISIPMISILWTVLSMTRRKLWR